MSAHHFPNKRMLVVVMNGEDRFESFCQCGYRAHGLDLIAVGLKENDHIESVSGKAVARLFGRR